jgi:PIN domain nuclease of toxin-antitoxin system
MRLLLDTHILLWAVRGSSKLPLIARQLIADPQNSLHFSVMSLWEIVIKSGYKRPDFDIDARELRPLLLSNGYRELSMSAQHALHVMHLPPLHRDPFDRAIIAQTLVEGLTLVTHDTIVADYHEQIMLV